MNKRGQGLNAVMFFLAIVVLLVMYSNIPYQAGYQQGQIDCLQNKVKYEQVNEMKWREIK